MRAPRIKGFPHHLAMREHAIARLWQRCGIAISPSEYARLCEKLTRKTAVTFGYEACPVYEVKVRDVIVYAVWSPPQGCICTFLQSLSQVKQERGGA